MLHRAVEEMSAIVSEFLTSPIATTSAAVSLILVLLGWGYTTFRYSFRDRSPQAEGERVKLSTSHGLIGDGLFLAVAVLLSVAIGTSLVAQYAFRFGAMQGTFVWILLYFLTLITVSVFVGSLLKNWIKDNTLIHLPKTKKHSAVAYLNDVEIGEFAKRVGFGVSGTCAFIFWMNSIEAFNVFMSSTAIQEIEQTFAGMFSIGGTFLGIWFGGSISGYLFRMYSGISKFPLMLKEMAESHWAEEGDSSIPPNAENASSP